MCMGIADLIPGISGGTVAFVLGMYEELLASIQTFNAKTALLLFKGQFTSFFRSVSWKLPLVCLLGIISSFIAFSHLFSLLLHDEVYRVFLYSLFLGLVLGSSVKLCTHISWNRPSVLLLLSGIAIACMLSAGDTTIQLPQSSAFFLDPWLVGAGCIAAVAMLLPGISGSYMLTVLGLYGTALGALVDWIDGIFNFSFNTNAFYILMSLAMGVLGGIIIFSRLIRFFLSRFYERSAAFLIGFMIGSCRALWAFDACVGLGEPFSAVFLAALCCALGGFGAGMLCTPSRIVDKKNTIGIQ